MHSQPQLAAAVAACRTHAIPYHNLAYRASALRFYGDFATAAPLYTASPSAGSRYVRRNGPPALYVSLDSATPYDECNQDVLAVLRSPSLQHGAVAFGAPRPHPIVVTCVHIKIDRLLDLFDYNSLSLLGVRTTTELLAPWKGLPGPTATQVLGQAVYDDGHFEGIIYPSAQVERARNIVLFCDRLTAPSLVHFRGFTPPPSHLRDAQIPDARAST